jgi:hypothetical protein
MPRTAWLPAVLVVFAAGGASAQTVAVGNLDEGMYREMVTEQRRQVVSANLDLGVAERERFWKIYDDYVKERDPIEKERFSLLQRIAQTGAGVSEDQAMALALASGRLQIAEIQLRLKYAEELRRKMSGRVAARFFQIDDFVTTALRANSLQGIPLVSSPGR